MRLILIINVLMLCGCNPGLVFNSSPEMTPSEMLKRASFAFVGVIERQQIDSSPFFRLKVPPIEDSSTARFWKILRRRVRVELILRGSDPRTMIDVYEIFWTGAATGDWNFTRDGERALFLVRIENGRYHVVRDWRRSIFPVTTGRHTKIPLNDSYPLWERIALMNWWIERADDAARVSDLHYTDPGGVLTQWRRVKLLRGLVRHPSAMVRVPACRELLLLGGWGQDECWETLSDTEKPHLSDGGWLCCSAEEIVANRRKVEQRDVVWWWKSYPDRESRRLLTAINHTRLRTQFCSLWANAYPDDLDNGCPADRPPPATIVTIDGDVPLPGGWPNQPADGGIRPGT